LFSVEVAGVGFLLQETSSRTAERIMVSRRRFMKVSVEGGDYAFGLCLYTVRNDRLATDIPLSMRRGQEIMGQGIEPTYFSEAEDTGAERAETNLPPSNDSFIASERSVHILVLRT
jgi:hypothetical protein